MSRLQDLPEPPCDHSAPLNFIDLLVAVDQWSELPERTRRVLKANVRTAGFIAVRSKARTDGRNVSHVRDDTLLATAPVNIPWLNEYLYAHPAELSGATDQCRNLSISGLRRVLRHMGLIAPYAPSTMLPTDCPWRQLLDAVEDAYCQTALSTFGTWCHMTGIAPADVSASTVDTFEAHVRSRTLHAEIPRLIRGVCKAWPKAAVLIPDGNGFLLKPPTRRETYSLPLSKFPQSFQDDVIRFQVRISGDRTRRPFRGDGPRRPLRSSTIKIRLDCIRASASALVLTGRDIATVKSLASLVEIEAFETILIFFWERARKASLTPEQLQAGDEPDTDVGVTTFTGSIAATLMMVAKHHCSLDPQTVQQLREMAQDMTPPPQTELSPKNRERLRQFDDPVTRAKLLHLPRRLMKLAEDGDLRPLEAARLARLAAAIEILLHVPLRNGNLTSLGLGQHLRYGSGTTIRHIVLQAGETKNRYNGEWPVGQDLATMLEWYITRFRPMLNTTGGNRLFPAGFGKTGSLSRVAMSQQIIRVVAEEVRAVVNPHLFRCICARLIIESDPGALEDVRLMIGDKSLQIVLAHYNASRPADAAARTDKTLRRLRSGSASLVAQLIKPKRKPRK